MGQSASQTTSHSSRKKSMRSPFSKRKKRSPLSATFTAPVGFSLEALNINSATVEQVSFINFVNQTYNIIPFYLQLMTLPGINRKIAQSIIDHRKLIGRFQKIDDLALVSGIGAEKLEKIRPDICVRKYKPCGSINESIISSRTASLDSVISEPTYGTQTKLLLNINKSTVFQLQQIHEINQELAANIIDYRERKGNFRKLDDLVKVKGMTRSRLGTIRAYLSITDEDLPRTPKMTRHASTLTAIAHSSRVNSHNQSHHQPRSVNRKSMSLPVKMSASEINSFSSTPVNDIFELLGAYSHRPMIEENYRYVFNNEKLFQNNFTYLFYYIFRCERNGFSTIRLTSWNLDRFDFEKSENLGVKEVICRTILENRLSILCLQEILDPKSLQTICDELNSPTLKRVVEWRENSRNWKCFSNQSCKEGWLNGLGFIYDADFSQWVDLESTEIYLDDTIEGENYDDVPPTGYLAAFKLSDWTCYILNIYLRYFNLLNTNFVLKCVEKQLDGRVRSDQLRFPTINDVFLVAGDFSGVKYCVADQYKRLTKSVDQNVENLNGSSQTTVDIDLKNLGFYGIVPNSATKVSKCDQIISSCNILCREKLSNETTFVSSRNLRVPLRKNCNEKLTGHSGVITKGLHHMAIPKGWNWGGPVSNHCPLWVEIYRRSNRDEPAFNQSTPLRGVVNRSVSLNRKLSESRNGSRGTRHASTSGVENGLTEYTSTNGDNISGIEDLNVSKDSVFFSDNSRKEEVCLF